MMMPSLFDITEIELVYRNKQSIGDRPIIRKSQNAYDVLLPTWDMNKIELVEQFKILLLDVRGAVIGVSDIATGGYTSVIVDKRVIFGIALKAKALAIILAHNHPGGTLNPSKADISLTEEIVQAGKILGVRVDDHLIVSRSGYYSFADNSMIPG